LTKIAAIAILGSQLMHGFAVPQKYGKKSNFEHWGGSCG
jgi:hypothetical protein